MNWLINFIKEIFKSIDDFFNFDRDVSAEEFKKALSEGKIKEKPERYNSRLKDYKDRLDKLKIDDHLGKLLIIKDMEPKIDSSAEDIEFAISYGWYETKDSKEFREYLEHHKFLKENEVIVRQYKNIYLDEIEELMKKINFSQEELKQ